MEFIRNHMDFIVGASSTVVGFSLYVWISNLGKIRSSFVEKFGEEDANTIWVVYQRVVGMLFLGVFPVLLVLTILDGEFSHYGINTKNPMFSLYWFLGLVIVIVPSSLYFSSKPDNYKFYPQIRLKEWNFKVFLINALSWSGYLLAYEFLFRGLLLFSSISLFSAIYAIGINIILYALAHTHKGRKEAIGSIPVGILLCIITLETGSMWTAFLAHVVMALSNDIIALKANPNMNPKLSA